MKSRKTRRSQSNRNSRIVTSVRTSSELARQTFTSNRDEGSLIALAQTESNNATTFTIARGGAQLQLNGNEARTLFSVLAKHYYGY